MQHDSDSQIPGFQQLMDSFRIILNTNGSPFYYISTCLLSICVTLTLGGWESNFDCSFVIVIYKLPPKKMPS